MTDSWKKGNQQVQIMIKSSPGLRYVREMLMSISMKYSTRATQYIMNIKCTKSPLHLHYVFMWFHLISKVDFSAFQIRPFFFPFTSEHRVELFQ